MSENITNEKTPAPFDIHPYTPHPTPKNSTPHPKSPFLVITDIGSTTTKALLLSKDEHKYSFSGIATAYTTVEKPDEDVRIGLYKSIKNLENQTHTTLLTPDSTPENIVFTDDTSYLTTSSAGGGLQILVIGLTKVDSAASAQRVAFGVGGVVLDTIAIDDKKSAIEKLQTINSARPDIILFCGGVDGGALYSVYRLAEILKLASPKQKFSQDTNIPLVFAGNVQAADYIDALFAKMFDLHFVPNIRPTMTGENLEPAKEKIHELFMENVMEQAPGYSNVKKMVCADIIPTPAGVLNTLKIIGKKYNSVIAFDIGGATTDVFSNIAGRFHRTVSANLGMSYSIGNVLASADFDADFAPYLQTVDIPNISEVFQNYIANKNLYPDYLPNSEIETFFEGIIAIKAIELAQQQHFDMHFNIKRIGFLDIVKNMVHRDKFKETMYYPHYDKSFLFNMSQIEVIIASGGIISHATPAQTIFIVLQSLRPKGLTHIWRDLHFISPHLGVLSTLDEGIAEQLVYNTCYEKIALVYRPLIALVKEKPPQLSVKINDIVHPITYNTVFYHLPQSVQKATFYQGGDTDPDMTDVILENGVPFIIDTRTAYDISVLLTALKPYKLTITTPPNPLGTMQNALCTKNLSPVSNLISFALSYPGDILVNIGQAVTPDTLIAQNRFDPPQIYVILLSAMLQTPVSEEMMFDGLLIREGDTVEMGDLIFQGKTNALFWSINTAYSPVRGLVESLNYTNGTIILREIQDYPTKPIEVNIAKALAVRPQNIKGYLKVRTGDFVVAGATLARGPQMKGVCSPYTGTIKGIDTTKGNLTIQYDKKPFQIFAQSFGTVETVIPEKSVDIRVLSTSIEGKIGFSVDRGGIYYPLERAEKDCITYTPHVTYDQLVSLADKGINGLIVNSISYGCLKRFLGADIGVALTGNETIPFSLLILTGFSTETLVDETAFFEGFIGKYLLLKPKTQIRAGAVRPVAMGFRKSEE